MLAIPLTLWLPVLLLFVQNQYVTSFVLDYNNNKQKITRHEYKLDVNNQSDNYCDNIQYDGKNVDEMVDFDGFQKRIRTKRIKRQADVFSYDFGKLSRLKVNKGQLIKYLLVPALIMSGLIPYILPPIKMAVMIVSMLTNMAFTSALFTLVRSYIFDPRPEEDNVVYYNMGYKKDKIKPVKEPNYDHKPIGSNNDFVIVYPDEEKDGQKISDNLMYNVPIDVSITAAQQFQKINNQTSGESGESLVLPPVYDSVNQYNPYVKSTVYNQHTDVEQSFNNKQDYINNDLNNIDENQLRRLK